MKCQYSQRDLALATWPNSRLPMPLRRYWHILKRGVWHASILGPLGLAERVFPSAKGKRKPYPRDVETLNLQHGEWVEVRSAKEIFATLDAHGKNMGLSFTREMVKFCGRRFRVYKRLNKIVLETTAEMRTLKAPTVLLEGVICDGEFHGGCTRSCFCFWREAWLKRVA